MQKLITVTVDTKQLSQSPNNPFTITEVDSINELLEQGWEIEEWDFLKEGEGDGEIILLVILNDDAMFDEDDEDFNNEFGFDDDIDDELDEIEDGKISFSKKSERRSSYNVGKANPCGRSEIHGVDELRRNAPSRLFGTESR